MATVVVHVRTGLHSVYIGRQNGRYPASKWANPIRLVNESERYNVLMQYTSWLKTKPDLIAALPELRGQVLGCWCHPLMCHGDVLARLANVEDPMAEIDVIMGELGEGIEDD